MWPQVAAPSRSPWTAQVHALAPRSCLIRDVRPNLAAQKPPAPRPTPKAGEWAGGDMCGVVIEFDSLSCVKELPAEIAEVAGFDRAGIFVGPGAFDTCLKRCTVGKVEGCVRFQFDHNHKTKTASTISGAVKFFADRRALYFYVTGSTRDGANTIKSAMSRKGHREVSAGFYVNEYIPDRGKNGEPNAIYVTDAELYEVSLVPAGAFPRTGVCFL